jgi:catechol 2,3-dioxygenase-like lactoylglutathione lyase family enzyme
MGGSVDGIGGVFLFSQRPARLAGWYRRVLGLRLRYLGDGVYYIELYYRSLHRRGKKLHTVFAIMRADAPIARRRNQAMVNYRVDDLEAFIARLRRQRIRVDPIHPGPDAEGIGKFTHLRDPEGNRLEVWEPSTGV